MSTAPTTPDPYDLLPYPDVIVKSTSPSHLGAVALLLGASPAAPARILELGCGTGANTRAIAQEWPSAHVLGIDLSARQIQMAQAASASVPNVSFQQADILADHLLSLPPFDFIICHGVYSWVPPPVQARILHLAGQRLTPQGIALVSFNVLPGWHVKTGLRDILRFHTAPMETLEEKLEQARAYLQLIVDGIGHRESWTSLNMSALAESILAAPPSYLQHEYLCDFNEPLYFTTFAQRAAAAGLQYVGDADFGTNVPASISAETRQILQTISLTRERFEQHLDFLTNRTFRRAILMRTDAIVTGRFTSSSLVRLRFRAKDPQSPTSTPLGTLMNQLHPAYHPIEFLAAQSHIDLLTAATQILTGIAEGWVEPRMVD